jgi:hypothetical protein
MNEKLSTKTPLKVLCKSCDHHWTAAYLPMPMDKCAALLKGACCPVCGENKAIFLDASDGDKKAKGEQA